MSVSARSNRKLRVAVLNRHFGYRFGGAERYAAAVVEELALRHEVHVFAQEIEHNFPGVTYHRIARPLSKPRWINQFWFALESWRQTRRGYDVVHSHENTWHGDLQTVHVRPLRIGLFHGREGLRRALKWISLCLSPRLLMYWRLEAARFHPKPGRQVAATSTQVMSEALTAYPSIAPFLHVISPGVQAPTSLLDPKAARVHLRLPLDVKLALFIGNDYAKKGLATLLEALACIPNLHLAVVGSGQHKADFVRQAEQLAVSERVHFLGSQPDMGPAYAAADLLVHPTTEDTYAMVVLEAMAHGLPVIVSSAAHCGIAADLNHEQQALILTDPRNAQLLASLLKQLLDDPALQAQMKFHGHLFASERSWETVGDQYDALLQLICKIKIDNRAQ